MNRYYSVRIIFHNTILGLPWKGGEEVSSLIRLRVKLSIEDTILLCNKTIDKGRKIAFHYKKNPANYECDLDLAIFISQ
ncbi:hypothetical protein DDW12_05075 [Sulfolobus islandicus]|nr:hypothetical protein DDW12_05075 [Sulfolobus islandicus]